MQVNIIIHTMNIFKYLIELKFSYITIEIYEES